MDDTTVDQMLGSILQQKLKLSVKAIAIAKEIAWQETPMQEKALYLHQAEQAVKDEMQERKPH